VPVGVGKRLVAGTLLGMLVLAGTGDPAHARARHEREWVGHARDEDARSPPRGPRGGEYRGRQPRERAAERARRSSRGGRVLSAEPDGDEGYRVRVLTPDGYIRNLTVDPRRHED
jgi:hypothetical protein